MVVQKTKRLYRSTKNKIIAGVCGGLAEYFGVDPVIVRIIWVAFLLLSFGIAVIIYLILWLVVPKK